MKEETEKLILMNERLSILLGYATALLSHFESVFQDRQKKQYKWFLKSIDHLFYLDKPFPPMPKE